MRLKSLNGDMFKPFRSHRRFLGWSSGRMREDFQTFWRGFLPREASIYESTLVEQTKLLSESVSKTWTYEALVWFWGEVCWVLQVRVASGVNTEFPYRVCIVDRGLIVATLFATSISDSQGAKHRKMRSSRYWYESVIKNAKVPSDFRTLRN